MLLPLLNSWVHLWAQAILTQLHHPQSTDLYLAPYSPAEVSLAVIKAQLQTVYQYHLPKLTVQKPGYFHLNTPPYQASTSMLLFRHLGSRSCLLAKAWPQILRSIIKRHLSHHPYAAQLPPFTSVRKTSQQVWLWDHQFWLAALAQSQTPHFPVPKDPLKPVLENKTGVEAGQGQQGGGG